MDNNDVNFGYEPTASYARQRRLAAAPEAAAG